MDIERGLAIIGAYALGITFAKLLLWATRRVQAYRRRKQVWRLIGSDDSWR
jgi:hypothetical protein